MVESIEPLTYEEALSSGHAKEWQHAIDDEWDSLQENSTWTLRDLTEIPPEKTVLRNKWLFKLKSNANGTVRYKARLVVKGYEQQAGLDYEETFAPVAKLVSLRVLLALAAVLDWEVIQLDVKTAFLYPVLEDEIYMELPEGYEAPGKVCKLRKSMYGLKQAPRAWYADIDDYLCECVFTKATAESNIYILSTFTLFLILYVDDILIFCYSLSKAEEIRDLLRKKYKMTDLGSIQRFLGIQIERNRAKREIFIHQQKYIEDFLQLFNLQSCNPVSIPLEPSTQFPVHKSPDSHQQANQYQYQYQRMVGKLMYAMTSTRPDLAYAVSILSKFSTAPTPAHMAMCKRVMRYLRGTSSYGILYGNKSSCIGYTDSDYAGDKVTRQSTSGFVFTLCGGAINWKSRQQSIVALSTTEAEYVAATEACKEMVWLNRLLNDLSIPMLLQQPADPITVQSIEPIPPPVLYIDNQAALSLAKNPIHHNRTKHIDIRFHFIRQEVTAGTINLQPIGTKDNLADIFTKPLSRVTFEKHRVGMGVTCCS